LTLPAISLSFTLARLFLEWNRSRIKKSRQNKMLERIPIAKVCQLLRKLALNPTLEQSASCRPAGKLLIHSWVAEADVPFLF
jgi:hypothetical protein